MLVDFGDIKRSLCHWIDAELDHRMILREDDPAVPHLQALKEPLVLIPHNPTAENIARLIFEARTVGRYARHRGLFVGKCAFRRNFQSHKDLKRIASVEPTARLVDSAGFRHWDVDAKGTIALLP